MKISQREARRLRKRVQVLESIETKRQSAWCQDWFGGSEIGRTEWKFDEPIPVSVRTARRLGHAVVAVGDLTGIIRFIALPFPKIE